MPSPRRISLGLLSVLSVAIGLVAGCRESSQVGPGAAAPGKVRLTYWVTPELKQVKGMEDRTKDFGDFEKIQAAEYVATHPMVEISVQALSSEELTKKVSASIAAGSPPDLLKDFLGRTSGYAHQDLLEDFTSALPPDELKDYDPYFVRLYTVNQTLHGLPMYYWVTHLVANRAIWEEAGKANLLPKEGEGSWTFDQFLNAMRAVAEKDKRWPFWAQFASEQGDYANHGFFWGMGAFMYPDGGDSSHIGLNTPEGAKALEFLVQLSREGIIPPGSTTMPYSELENMIGKGQTAAWGDSLFAFQRMEVAQREGRLQIPVKLQVMQFPHATGKKNPLPVGPTGIVVFRQNDSHKRDVALDFARWLNQPKFQATACASLRMFPTRKSVENPLADDKNYALVQKWIQQNGKVDLGLTSKHYYKVRVASVPYFQQAILGEKSPAEALKAFAAEADQILATGK